jgi:hypothetical protein
VADTARPYQAVEVRKEWCVRVKIVVLPPEEAVVGKAILQPPQQGACSAPQSLVPCAIVAQGCAQADSF